jgi:glycosyltransferase involved in cell wall biosynthesis
MKQNRSCPVTISYVPHGINHNIFKPLSADEKQTKEFTDFKKQILSEDYKFVLLFNSRNIRRKCIADTILAWRLFTDNLTLEERKQCVLLLHTAPVDDNGTDLYAVQELLCNEGCNVKFSSQPLSTVAMNYLYNLADGAILLTNNEGWGLSLTEAIMAGKMIIANSQGGMQDQMRFVDENGNWYTNNPKVPSNHKGTYKQHGKWALPVYPTNNSLAGSVPTPYIFTDSVQPEDAAKRIMELYKMTPEERTANGLAGREWATRDEAGFTAEKMGERVIDSLNALFSVWKPREKYTLSKDTDYRKRTLTQPLVY